VDIAIREMTGLDITREFLETLSSLAEVNLTVGQAAKVFQRRLRNNIRTTWRWTRTRWSGRLALGGAEVHPRRRQGWSH